MGFGTAETITLDCESLWIHVNVVVIIQLVIHILTWVVKFRGQTRIIFG